MPEALVDLAEGRNRSGRPMIKAANVKVDRPAEAGDRIAVIPRPDARQEAPMNGMDLDDTNFLTSRLRLYAHALILLHDSGR